MMSKAGQAGELVRAPMNSVNDLKKLDPAGGMLIKGSDSLASLHKSKKSNLIASQGSFDI